MAKAATLTTDLIAVSDALEARYGRRKLAPFDDFIEALIFQILELAAPEKAARDALSRIKAEYVDWNDMRVATVREIQDILGHKYVRCREKAEDLHSLLADLYTAFRKMELGIDVVTTQEGLDTLRALPETTLIRQDMVERALVIACEIKIFPCDEEQYELLQHLGGISKRTQYDSGKQKILEALDTEQLLYLARGLREHCDFLEQNDADGPQAVDWGWEKPKKAAAKKAAPKKAAAKKAAPKKAATKAEPTEKKAAAKATKKAAPKKAAAKPEPAEKKTAAKATKATKATKKAAPKKAAAKSDKAEPAEKKTAAKATKKAAPKKAAAKKAAPKKAAAKKAAPKKAAAKKSSTKKS